MKNKNKIVLKQTLPVIIFLLVIGGFSLISLVKADQEISVAENRKLAQSPKIKTEDLLSGHFQKEYENYLSDQFVSRDDFVAARTRIGIALGRRDLNDVYIGKDDYLIERYQEENFNRKQIGENAQLLAAFLDDMIRRCGQEHVHGFFVPSKENVLTRRLPAFAEAYDSAYVVDRVKDALAKKSPEEAAVITDLAPVLREHQDEAIYYRTDHHWTTLGAFYAYQEYCKKTGEKEPDAREYERTMAADDFCGTTYDKVQLELTADEIWRWQYNGDKEITVDFNDGAETWNGFYYDQALKEKDKYQYFLGGNEAKIHIHTPAANGKCLLLLKDSYSNCFVEFLARNYADIYMIDLRYMSQNIYDVIDRIETEQKITDVLSLYNREKFMNDNNMGQLENPGDPDGEEKTPENDEDEDLLQRKIDTDTDMGDVFGGGTEDAEDEETEDEPDNDTEEEEGNIF